ncbi:MAG: glutamate--tRNA ligase [Rhodospirillaceae bacterium]|nr:glutamate--tRNA ligase [Rhodospirillaceae bacterium]
MTPTFRFAPSPTGLLHIGNARPAVINWLFAQKLGGRFILRIDDTDTARSKPEFTAAIERDLAWLGLTWDGKEHQSARIASYVAATDKLKAANRLYPCYETPDELEFKRKLQLKAGKPPLYKRADHKVSDAERAKFEAEGRKPHWRFEIAAGEIAWDDGVRGRCAYRGENISDPVLVREDGSFLYMMPSVVDDIDMAMTHIVRGEDHVTNTAIQTQIWQALCDAPLPQFAHLPLLVDAQGKGLSKRMGSLSLQDLRENGLEPMAIVSLVAKLGSSDAIEARANMAQLIAEFDISHFGRSTPKFDPHDLEFLNSKILHELPFTTVRPRLEALGLPMPELDRLGEAFWNAVRGNLQKFSEAAGWWAICFAPHAPSIEDTTFIQQATPLLPDGAWDENTWHAWTEKVKEATGRKGKGLYLPLRMALTGLPHGPELKLLLPLIGRERVLKRLSGVTG